MKNLAKSSSGWAVPFFTIWTGQQLSLLGSSLAQFALVWWVTKTTGSATILTTATAAAILPNILLGPFLGALIDRFNRRRMLILADGFVALIAVWVVYLFWSGSMQVWHIYAILLMRAVGERIHQSTMLASTSLMVPERHLQRVMGMSQTVSGVVDILSPALGALLLSLLPIYNIMAVDVVTAAFAIGPLFFIAIPQPVGAGTARSTVLQDAREGLRYILHWRGLMALWAIAMSVNLLCGPVFYLTPILVLKGFQGGAIELGIANSIWGIGAVLGGVILSVWPGFLRGGRPWRIATLLAAVIGVGLGFLVVAFTPPEAFPLALAGLFIVGMISTISGGLYPVMIQTVVAPEMQGRVFSIFGTLVSAMLTLGMLAAGPLADWIGVQTPYLIGGLAQVLIGAAGFAVPALMGLEDGRAVLNANYAK